MVTWYGPFDTLWLRQTTEGNSLYQRVPRRRREISTNRIRQKRFSIKGVQDEVSIKEIGEYQKQSRLKSKLYRVMTTW